MSILTAIIGSEEDKLVAKLSKIADKVLLLDDEYSKLTLDEVKSLSIALRDKIRQEISNTDESITSINRILDQNMIEAFALTRQAAYLTLNMKHYKVQLIGGGVIHNGNIAEMRTGEGKTLVATLPAYLNALTGRGVHVVTVNDYLARRDAVWMGQIYDALGLTISVINQKSSYIYDRSHQELDSERDETGDYKIVNEFLKPITRQEAYLADITYGTNSEFGFDYLRDNIGYNVSELVQRKHYFAIVDEIDSILIDEARTPLIISGAASDSEELYKIFAKVVTKLDKETDYTVDEKLRAVAIKDSGIEKVERELNIPNLYSNEGVKYVHHLDNALKAKELFILEKQYVVKDGEVVIVDEFTGRMQPGRRWSDGLHQAVEAKEGVEIQKESRTLASITYQNYFRFYGKLSGMTGTGKTSSEEFFKVYNLPVVTIPTHNPIRRLDHNDLIFQTEKGKWKALTRKVKELHEKGQPVLIGTISIERNELLSKYLEREKIPHQVLNAKNHEREGEIIAEAGKKGAVTIATNMAGRGVDIKLGGPNASKEEADEVRALGGLYVIGTERHEARRIDNQLRGRSGRQGDVGETQFFVSLEDDLMRVFASDSLKNMMGKFGIEEDQPIEARMVSRALEGAQEKIEGFHFDSRKHTLQYDDVLNQQRKSVYERRRKFLDGDREYIDQVLNELVNYNQEYEDKIKEKRENHGESFYTYIRIIMIQIIDTLWMNHLDDMDHLRQSVNLRSYGQRDPLVEYKKEGLETFRAMNEKFYTDLMQFIDHIDMIIANNAAQTMQVENNASDEDNKTDQNQNLNRNDPCPCGRGKKIKKCDCKEYAYLRK